MKKILIVFAVIMTLTISSWGNMSFNCVYAATDAADVSETQDDEQAVDADEQTNTADDEEFVVDDSEEGTIEEGDESEDTDSQPSEE